MTVLRVLLLLVAVLGAQLSQAQTCPEGQTPQPRWCRTMDQFSGTCSGSATYATAAEACESESGQIVMMNGGAHVYKKTTSLGPPTGSGDTQFYCSTAWEPQNAQTPAAPDSYTSLARRVEDECVGGGGGTSPVCPGGLTETKNLTLGYYGNDNPTGAVPDYMPDGSRATQEKWDHQMQTMLSGSLCIGGCPWSVTGIKNAWVSRQPVPGQGLYRSSADFEMEMQYSEEGCTPGDADKDAADPEEPPPTCQGTSGYVNGRPACAPSSETNVVPSSAPTSKTVGNPTAGSEGGVEHIPMENGNGGNAGGPPHPKDGTVITPDGVEVSPTESDVSGTRTSVEGEEQVACGAPGQPRCRIDESGTPTGVGALDGAGQSVDATKDGSVSAIEAARDGDGGASAWTWTFSLPSGCTPFVVEALDVVLDICEHQEAIHDLMSMVWIISTVFGCAWLIFGTVQGGRVS